jgi:malonyl-CoA decarboxylase
MSGGTLATDALGIYKSLDNQGRIGFFKLLISDFSPSPDDVGRAADAYRQEPSTENLRQLQRVVEPPREELFRRLNMATGGTRALIEMRSDILNELGGHPDLEPIAADLAHLLASWFNSGFLTLERIDWQSSAEVLEKLIEYEAVHLIQGWTDLRRRLEADRRCYAFFHSALPTEPLIFIEVALTRGMSASIHPLLDPNAPVSDPESADSAIFYSITNCQKGLRGVPFGSSLIKQVVEDLRKSLPQLKTYATLSPIPGFRKWLGQELSNPESFVNDDETREIQAILEQLEPVDEGKWPTHLRQRLIALCAFYLLHEKRDSKPLDPVARFHLKNGARLERINPMADASASAIKQSAGMMANYVYELGDLQRNHDSYVRSGTVSSSGRIERLARQISKR